MAATKADIEGWVRDAKKDGATHLIVVCDTYDWGDFPVKVMPDEDVNKAVAEHSGKNMEKVMEVYSMKLDIEKQLAEHRAYHLD